jgi:hypothetical protein
MVPPGQLAVGDEVVISDYLPSEEGYRHVVDDVRDCSGGFVRVWFDVYEPSGERRATALKGRECFRWDRLYDVAARRAVGHKSKCSCARCGVLRQQRPMVEVVA